MDIKLTPTQKKNLLMLARESIVSTVEGSSPPVETNVESIPEKTGGLFVTLRINGNLRGCIGYIREIDSLEKNVIAAAESAAFKDPRFPPVNSSELSEIEIEISILSPLSKIKDIGEINIGKHGLFIQQGSQRGLLLPQVAVENNWDTITFLKHTCIKSGLPPESWENSETVIKIFSSEIINEE